MTGFISRPPITDEDPPAEETPELVTGDGWWPDIDLAALRDTVRLPADITAARLRQAIRGAMMDLARELADWRALKVEETGAEDLAEVEDVSIDGRPRLFWLYDDAVGAHVAANLQERYRDIGATKAGADRDEELRVTADEHRRNYRWAVSDIRGVPRATVELI